MRIIFQTVFLTLLFFGNVIGQNPHGDRLKLDCAKCHAPDSWEIPYSFWQQSDQRARATKGGNTGMPLEAEQVRRVFSHDETGFSLEGQHRKADCRDCHSSLVFDEAETACISCHTDVHRNTVGEDCRRCHTSDSWLVDNIVALHQDNGFPLMGAHATASCAECHTSSSGLEFNRIGNACINCHMADFASTTNPNHADAGFSVGCTECHQADARNWDASPVNHDFFPLTKGHDLQDCASCHTGGAFSETPTQCFACHLDDFTAALDPNHLTAGFSNDCASCHTTDPGWVPASFTDHDDLHFPIYSGAHAGTWNQCSECHHNAEDYTEFTCISCHFNPETDASHTDVGGYTYENSACLACHPTGNADDVFDHNQTAFPLTGAHLETSCVDCHSAGYADTPTACVACHQTDFDQSANPNHVALGFSSDCAGCHTTDAGWAPASFDNHDEYYALNGAHAAIANDCIACHNGDYNNTPNTCIGCHLDDFNQTSSPDHEAAQFPTDCTVCHGETAWTPANFDHNTYWPLTGAHAQIADDCAACHQGDYTNTPTTCVGCHATDFQGTANPDHETLGFSDDCISCHTTAPGWAPASMPNHDDYYVLNGAHAVIANDCAACHNGDYTQTPNTCVGCHQTDYNNTENPDHVTAQFSTDCASCHGESSWIPATFDHDNQYFPIYSGAHAGVWNQCAECHTTPGNYQDYTCVGCHINPETDEVHTGIGGYAYQDNACLACHPTGDADNVFDHNNTNFPLTGAHVTVQCLDCHAGGFEGTSTACVSCHQSDFNQAANPNHTALGLSTECAGCHTTDAGWAPARFDNHHDYYALNGAHAATANDCVSCHQGDYNNTPNTCVGCHLTDYNQTSDPDHETAQFPTDCASCHSEDAWAPSSFNHNDYYPLTGGHALIADDCVACHQGDYNNTPNTCIGCHTIDFNETLNPDHQALGFSTDCATCHTTASGWAPATLDNHDDYYVLNGAHAAIAQDCAACHQGDYNNTPNTCVGCHLTDFNQTSNPNHVTAQFSTDCASCHGESNWVPSTFDHDNQYFPIYSGAHEGEWNQCTECHTNPSNYAEFTCVSCHTNPDTDEEHEGVGGYVYQDNACLACHPTGDADLVFDHNTTSFALTGAHQQVNCLECHAAGFEGTSTACVSCHNPEYTNAVNPNHLALGLSTDCASCHTTDAGWAPASFADHNDFYALNGAHAAIANDCAACHNGDYTNTPNTCVGCHLAEYQNTNDPNHVTAQFSTDCASCHGESNWTPANFDHDDQYFPIYSGAHEGVWNQCAECHTNSSNYAEFSCVGCHVNPETNDEHLSVNGYVYDNNACLACHPTGDADNIFDHNTTSFALTGAHQVVSCAECHTSGYAGTPTACVACHETAFAQAENPNHVALGLSNDCLQCHTTDAGWAPASFADHNEYYVLNGAHSAIANDCAACHNGDYTNTPNTCVGCHLNEFNATSDPDHEAAQFPTDCASCHTENAWSPANFDHDDFYPLTGGHALIANDCVACHNGDYTNTPNTCAGCHTTDFNQATNPNHQALGFSTDCTSCHTTASGWAPATFADHNDIYPLNGAHAAIANDCAACHNGDYTNTPNTCVGCHLSDFNQTTDPDHEAAQFSTDCASCHTENAWSPSTFDHDDFYPLNGAHAAIANDCAACHNGDYTNTPNTCVGCHLNEFNATSDPDHEAAQFPTDCASCHTENAWSPANFDHDDFYPLTGGHALIANDCVACHNGDYTNTPNTCAGCHTTDFNQATNPNHQALGFSTDCTTCHTTASGWAPATFADHNDIYPLNGAHAAIANDCVACHDGDYTNTPNTCVGCHLNEFNATSDPDHEAAQFPTDCASCHTENAWIPASFDHDDFYPLTGGHALIANECAACHNGDYTNTPNTCAGCHTTDFNQATNPNHQALGFSTDCTSCHTTASGWAPATFADHNDIYPLNGAHAAIANDCAACHNGDYNNTPNTCVGCHLSDFNQTTDPDHEAAQFSTDCASCHTENAWSPSTFDHDDFYPLNGAHAAIANDCVACHDGDYTNTPNTCVGCHLEDFNQTTDPDHEAAQFPTDCASCHTENAWIPASFDHDDFYPLTGGHALIANECAACHNGDYTDTPNTCAGCHTTDFNQATNPNHVSLGLSMDCASCHTTAPDWNPASFSIHNDFYPLTGAHAAIANDCAACHNGDYTNTPNTCIGCHLLDYNQTTNPDHEAAQFSTNCSSCHNENAWIPSSFDHDNFYPLIGAHALIANNCVACHVGGNYSNTPNTCFGCHSSDYNGANNPPHQSAGFPTDCTQCHSQSAWEPSTFDHDDMYFPIYSGTHNNEWDQCTECHTTPGNFSLFSCIDCHEHDNPGDLADDHDGVNGYMYVSTACYACHPTGDD